MPPFIKSSAKSKLTRFAKQFLAAPQQIGSIIPSSTALAEKMVEGIDFATVSIVVEYGPGTGAFTQHIHSKLGPGTQFVAFEPNKDFIEQLKQDYPDRIIQPSNASEIKRHMSHSIGQVDAIVSGVPFSFMSRKEVLTTLEDTHEMLRGGGEFRTFVYVHTLLFPKTQLLLKHLRRLFERVEIMIVLTNVPPAVVIRCRK